jgi:hypothetical protein
VFSAARRSTIFSPSAAMTGLHHPGTLIFQTSFCFCF